MDQIDYEIELVLNITGYTGEELHSTCPDFITDRPVTLSLRWSPSAEGPESYLMIVKIAGLFLARDLIRPFLEELSKDLYSWVRDRLIPMLKTKRHPVGKVVVQIGNAELLIEAEEIAELEACVLVLPQLIEEMDGQTSGKWTARQVSPSGLWTVSRGQ